MVKLCVFAGTTEGRQLVEFLTAQQDAEVMACVATEYGETLLREAENLTISAQRLTEEEMEAMMEREGFTLVVDATHPYAPLVTENIVRACEKAGVEYLRLLREDMAAPEEAVYVQDIAGAVKFLSGEEGNILLTTGSKELAKYTAIRGFTERVFARVLPMEESLRLCAAAGVAPAHIIAMQGPFSREMNVAQLRSAAARFLVTKASGSRGGFGEKIAAAREAGARLVVIGRPPQRQGLGFQETVAALCRRFGWVSRPRISVVGIGPGSRGSMTAEVREAIDGAECVIGARRMLEAAVEGDKTVFAAIAPGEIAEIIEKNSRFRRFAVVMSGDTGFYSGTRKLLPLLGKYEVEVLPGLSSLSCLCARLGVDYEDVAAVSLHGRERNIAADVARHSRVFALVGGENGVGKLCRTLTEQGLGGVTVHVGEQLSYPDERITSGTAASLATGEFAALSAVLIENPQSDFVVTTGLPNDAFARTEAVPMTKSEVRAVCLAKLRLRADSVCWDVGAGTGSVAVEMARLAHRGQVYAIEKKEAALAVLRENTARFGLSNVCIVPGAAPEACGALSAPSHVFLGGCSGHMRQMVALAREKNPRVRLVATAITLESIAELTAILKEFSFTEKEVVALTVAKGREAGPYHLMMGQNPIYIFTMGEKEE